MLSKLEAFNVKPSFNFDSALTVANIVFVSTERLAALNLSTARAAFEQSTANFKSLLGAKDVQSLISLQAAQAQPALDKVIAYSRGVYDIASQTKEQLAKAVEVQFADTNAKVAGLVDKALKSAPAGSEAAVATIRKTIDAANSAYDNLNKVAKQVTEIAEANVTAASQATLKAAAVVAEKAAA